MNFNSNLKTIDEENFQTALNLYNEDLKHTELIDLIRSSSVVNKQIAVLKLENIQSENDAQLLVDNLTGQDGKVREAVSFKLNEFMANPQFIKYFQNPNNSHVFLMSSMDINGNICRNTISAICHLKSSHAFCINLAQELVTVINALVEKIETFVLQDGKYKVNKEIFKLYWALEVMYEFVDFISLSDIKSILRRVIKVEDYTIREKAAKILTKDFQDADLQSLKEKLKLDKNYYVRRF